MTQMQKIHFQLSLPSGPYFENPITQESESFERIQKFRKLSQQYPHNYAQQVPSNLYQGPQREIINKDALSLQPAKTVVKGLYEKTVYPKPEGMMLNSSSPLSKDYQSQLEKMKQVGQTQKSQIEKQLMYKKTLSLSTASCSPNIEDEIKSASPIDTTNLTFTQGFESCEPKVPEKMYHNLAENQMKTIQAMLTAKPRNSQMDNISNQRSLYEGHMHGSGVQNFYNEENSQTMRNPMHMNEEMIQRFNAYRTMQYKFAMQQRVHHMMQQKLLQNNQILKDYNQPQMHNISSEFDYTGGQNSQISYEKKYQQGDMLESFQVNNDKIANKTEDIDIFFSSSDSKSEESSPFKDSFFDTF